MPFRRLVAYVWVCGDDYCDCSQAVIQAHHLNCRHLGFDGKVAHRVQGDYLWEGEFRTDHDPGAWSELDATLETMRAYWPDVAEDVAAWE